MPRTHAPIGVDTPAAAANSEELLDELPHEKLAWMLQKMCEIRYFEEKAEELYVRGQVHCTMHLSIIFICKTFWRIHDSCCNYIVLNCID